jgi:hypothetical protein
MGDDDQSQAKDSPQNKIKDEKLDKKKKAEKSKSAEQKNDEFISIFMLIFNTLPLIFSYIYEPLSSVLGTIAFLLSIYFLNAFEVMFGKNPTHLKIPGKKIKRINFYIALTCTLFMLGISTTFQAMLDIFDFRVNQVQFDLTQDYMSLISIVGGIAMLIIGGFILTRLTFKPLLPLGQSRLQLFQSMIYGFIIYSIFLGIGGENLINYILILASIWGFLISLKNAKAMKGDVKGIAYIYKSVTETSGDVEDSFWGNWVNFYKTPATRFYGIMMIAAGFLFGLNFRFFEPSVDYAGSQAILLYQILVLAILAIPFFLANVGMKNVWKGLGKIILMIIPFTVMFVIIFIEPSAMSWQHYLILARPDSEEVIRMYYGGGLLLVFLIITTASIFNSWASTLSHSTLSAVKNIYYYLLSDITIIVGIFIGGFLGFHYQLRNDPTNTLLLVAIIIGFWVAATFAALFFYSLKRYLFFQEIYLNIHRCTKCQKELDHEKNKCSHCKASTKEIVWLYMKDHSFAFPKTKNIASIILVIIVAIFELATFYFFQKISGLFLLAALNCGVYLWQIERIIKVPTDYKTQLKKSVKESIKKATKKKPSKKKDTKKKATKKEKTEEVKKKED